MHAHMHTNKQTNRQANTCMHGPQSLRDTTTTSAYLLEQSDRVRRVGRRHDEAGVGCFWFATVELSHKMMLAVFDEVVDLALFGLHCDNDSVRG